ncbi:MurR/RpiR family transcriptional regulator [Streptomyces asiaticus]
MSGVPGEFASVRKLLLGRMDGLTPGERKVARALLAQYPTAGLTTSADLAAAADVSPPTVIRFATRLGFEGFPGLQRSLLHELHSEGGSPLVQYEEKPPAYPQGILRETRQAFVDMVDASYDGIPESEFSALVGLLSDTTREVCLVGGRFSHVLADYLLLHLRLLRAGVRMVGEDEAERLVAVADAGQQSVFVVFDYRRYTDANLRFAQEVRRRGATVALMTDNWLSPIAKVSKVVLPCRVQSASPFDSLVAAMAVTESLVAGVAGALGEGGRARLTLIESVSLDD